MILLVGGHFFKGLAQFFCISYIYISYQNKKRKYKVITNFSKCIHLPTQSFGEGPKGLCQRFRGLPSLPPSLVGGCKIYKAPIFLFRLLVWYILRTFAKEIGHLGEKTPSNRLYKNFSLLSQNHKTLKFDRQEAVFSNVQMVPGGHHL